MAPSIRRVMEKWIPFMTAKPFVKLTNPAEVREYKNLIGTFQVMCDAIHSWIPNLPKLQPLFWDAAILLPAERARLKPMALTVTACWLIDRMRNKEVSILAAADEPTFIDPDALGFWQVAQVIPVEAAKVAQQAVPPPAKPSPVPVIVEEKEAAGKEIKLRTYAVWINSKNRARATIERGWTPSGRWARTRISWWPSLG